ncbi:Actin cross-linking protein [Zea mays]|uniref:Actin cross-linking protein n=1 Tax=Zea mays TaxID=4577 RepID=A0A1D6KIH7_MAIZE|nr:Actin cross-linking protein [Zea mays]
MELFARAKVVRLRSHHNKFLYVDKDEVRVTQDRDGSSANARWTFEAAPHSAGAVRLRSRYGRYLTASGESFLLGMTGRKARLRTKAGHFLRANGGLPPWRNSVTHDVPHRTATQDWVLWDVELFEAPLDEKEILLRYSSALV